MTLVDTPAIRLTQDSATAVASPAAETAILTTTLTVGPPPPVAGMPARAVKIVVVMNITEGTTGTAYVVRCRQGNGLGGAVVGAPLTATLAAAANDQATFVFRDASGFLNQAAGGQYTISVAETGATANGTVNDIDVVVET